MTLLHRHRQQLTFLLLSLVSSLSTSVTTHSYRWFHYISSGGGPLPPTILNVVVDSFRNMASIFFRLWCVFGTFRWLMRRPGLMPGQQPAGGGGGGGRQGGRPKQEVRRWLWNLGLRAFIRQQHSGQGGGNPRGEPAHGHGHSSGGNNRRRHLRQHAKGKISVRRRRGVLLLLLLPLFYGDVDSVTIEDRGGGWSNENLPTPPDLGGVNNAAPK